MKERFMIVVAHADDEVLGAGGWMFQASEQGHDIHVVVMSTDSPYRTDEYGSNAPIIEGFEKTLKKFNATYSLLEAPDASFNLVPLRYLVEGIEHEMRMFKPTVMITHHPNDLNEDHKITSKATQIASRLPQRHSNFEDFRIKALLYLEIPCSTSWTVDGIKNFQPNTFVEIRKKDLNNKINCLKEYDDVLRPEPHPRSIDGIETLAKYRGSQIGVKYAEAFETAYRLENVTWKNE